MSEVKCEGTTKQYFETEEHVEKYEKYRSELPSSIVQKIISYLGEEFVAGDCVGVDVGCGSGQNTRPIARLLKKAIGIDISREQISRARLNAPFNVEYLIGSCDDVPVSDVHLVLAVNALLWFDRVKFFREADRMLVSRGVLALVGESDILEIKGFEEKSLELYLDLKAKTRSCWDNSQDGDDYGYDRVVFPYANYIKDSSVSERVVPVSYVIGHLRTYSGIAKFLREYPIEGKEIMNIFEKRLMDAIGCTDASANVIYVRRHVILMGRK